MPAGKTPEGEAVDLITVFEAVGAYQAGKIDEKRLRVLDKPRLPACGSCSGMFHGQQHELPDGSPGDGPALQRTALRNQPSARRWRRKPAR